MDTDSISYLEGLKKALDNSFQNLEKGIKSFKTSDKNKELKALRQELQIIENKCNLLEDEIGRLKIQENSIKWKKILSEMKKKKKTYENKINKLEKNNIELIDDSNRENNVVDINAKIDYNKLTSQQAMQRGDNILKEDGKIINNIEKTLNQGIDNLKQINIDLYSQNEKLDNVEIDVKEIGLSLDKAKKQITNMIIMYSKDKIITCLILFILIIIITIIIVSACGGDKKNNFNAPHDIFFTSRNSTSNKGEFLYNQKILKYLIYLLIIFDFS